jgi:hypothetical protein
MRGKGMRVVAYRRHEQIGRVAVAVIAAAMMSLCAWPSRAADEPTVTLGIRAHRFEPDTMDVPANVKFKLIVHNYDATPEEFESAELRREKVVAGNSEITIYIGPLSPGTYPYFGDFHQDTAQGRFTAK